MQTSCTTASTEKSGAALEPELPASTASEPWPSPVPVSLEQGPTFESLENLNIWEEDDTILALGLTTQGVQGQEDMIAHHQLLPKWHLVCCVQGTRPKRH